MLDAPHFVRAAENLKAAVFARGRVKGDEAACHVRQQAAVVVPVAVILVPLPGSPDERLLKHHLGVVVVDLPAQELLHSVDDAP
jgi:hypothetical protein